MGNWFNHATGTHRFASPRRAAGAITLFAALCIALTPAYANAQTPSTATGQTYPAKPVRLVIPVAAGGNDDFIGRIVTQGLTTALGQPFVVDNRPGSGGVLGQEVAAKSPADGYTLLLGGGSMTGAQFVRAKLPFDVMRDFAPVSLVTILQSCLLVHPAVPARNVKEFIAHARARPGKLNFGSTGVGQTGYFSAAYFNGLTKIDAIHVPYKSGSVMFSDAMAGQIDFLFVPIGGAVTQTQGGKLRALAVTGAKRSMVLADVPTIAEAALPSYELTTWLSILAPAGTPRSTIDTLNAALVRVIALPENRDRVIKSGAEPASSTPEELTKRMAEGVEKYGRIAKMAGLKPE
jgi:tripartite-type tricarboxylate transporter receptor subunit TctC